MSINTIDVNELSKIAANTPIDLIDVRTPGEYETVHAKDAKLFPLDSLDPKNIAAQRRTPEDQPLYMICKMGGRSMKACEQFVAAGIPNVVNVTGGTDAWVAAGHPSIKGERKVMAIDRQMRIAAGLLVLIGVLLSLKFPWAIWVAGFVGAGLVFSGVTDTCGMVAVLAKMPWNRPKGACGTGG
ncbi:MAG: rhodanese-like domain-containing protein [Planctomycetaceae bacterium]